MGHPVKSLTYLDITDICSSFNVEVHACGPVRPKPGSPVEEIVVLVRNKTTYYDYDYTLGENEYRTEENMVYILNIATSSWRTGDLSLHTAAHRDSLTLLTLHNSRQNNQL